MLYVVTSTLYIEHSNEATKQKKTIDSLVCSIQGESKKSDDCDMYNRNVIPCGV